MSSMHIRHGETSSADGNSIRSKRSIEGVGEEQISQRPRVSSPNGGDECTRSEQPRDPRSDPAQSDLLLPCESLLSVGQTEDGLFDAVGDGLMSLLLPEGISGSKGGPISLCNEVSDLFTGGNPSAAFGTGSDTSGSIQTQESTEGIGTSSSSAPASDSSTTNKFHSLVASDPLVASASSDPEATRVRVQNVIASGRIEVEGRPNASLDLRRIAISCRLAEYNPRKINACIVRLRKPKCTGLIFRSGRVMVTGAESEGAAHKAARILLKIVQAVLGEPPCPAPQGNSLPDTASENISTITPALGDAFSTSEESARPRQGLASDNAEESPLQRPRNSGADSEEPAKGPEEDSLGILESLTSQEITVTARSGSEASQSKALARRSNVLRGIKLSSFAIENVVATADCGLPVRLEGLAFDHKEFCSYEPELFAGLVYRYSPTPSSKAVLLIFVSGKVVITGCRSAAEIQEVYDSFFPVLLKYHT